jgi:hypothetical protein
MEANIMDLKEGIISSQVVMKSIVDAWMTDIKDARKKTTACQEVTGANPENMEPNPEEKEAVLERQEILKEEVAIQSLKACRNETTSKEAAIIYREN